MLQWLTDLQVPVVQREALFLADLLILPSRHGSHGASALDIVSYGLRPVKAPP